MRTKLDGRDFNLSFSWNEREERWYLAMADEEENVLVAGIKLVSNWPLLRYYHFDPRVPPGELVVHDLTSSNAPPGFDELGIDRRCQLGYYAISTG
jgi:hypothetical protein